MVQPAPIEALNHWTFRPAQLNGQAVALKILIASVILNFLGFFGQIFGTVWARQEDLKPCPVSHAGCA